jgi:hypothetical protein
MVVRIALRVLFLCTVLLVLHTSGPPASAAWECGSYDPYAVGCFQGPVQPTFASCMDFCMQGMAEIKCLSCCCPFEYGVRSPSAPEGVQPASRVRSAPRSSGARGRASMRPR